MKNILVLIAAMMVSGTAFAYNVLSFEESKAMACNEAARLEFEFDGTCDDYFSEPEFATEVYFEFFGHDASGDCGISVTVDRYLSTVKSKVTCL